MRFFNEGSWNLSGVTLHLEVRLTAELPLATPWTDVTKFLLLIVRRGLSDTENQGKLHCNLGRVRGSTGKQGHLNDGHGVRHSDDPVAPTVALFRIHAL